MIPTEEGEGAEIRRPVVKAKAVVEQRVSHFIMGLGIIGTMTGPLLVVLHTMPTAIFAGVFFTVGWGSIESNSMLKKAIFLMQENRFIQRDDPLLTIRKRKILLFIGLQGLGVAATVAISQTIAAIGKIRSPSLSAWLLFGHLLTTRYFVGFPVLIILLIPLRVWALPRWFNEKELDVLDDPTADNSAVLRSLGGPPKFPGQTEPPHEGLARRYSEQRSGVPRQRAGSITR
jgi:hypothetical protein